MTAAPCLADPNRHRPNRRVRLFRAVKRRPIPREGESTLRRLPLLPALAGAMDGLTRLTPTDPALDELVNERPERLPLVKKAGKRTGHTGSVQLAGGTRIRKPTRPSP